eukprot:scaffold42856_cov87-Phaeocystis_antarctica.AAC.3
MVGSVLPLASSHPVAKNRLFTALGEDWLLDVSVAKQAPQCQDARHSIGHGVRHIDRGAHQGAQLTQLGTCLVPLALSEQETEQSSMSQQRRDRCTRAAHHHQPRPLHSLDFIDHFAGLKEAQLDPTKPMRILFLHAARRTVAVVANTANDFAHLTAKKLITRISVG